MSHFINFVSNIHILTLKTYAYFKWGEASEHCMSILIRTAYGLCGDGKINCIGNLFLNYTARHWVPKRGRWITVHEAHGSHKRQHIIKTPGRRRTGGRPHGAWLDFPAQHPACRPRTNHTPQQSSEAPTTTSHRRRPIGRQFKATTTWRKTLGLSRISYQTEHRCTCILPLCKFFVRQQKMNWCEDLFAYSTSCHRMSVDPFRRQSLNEYPPVVTWWGHMKNHDRRTVTLFADRKHHVTAELDLQPSKTFWFHCFFRAVTLILQTRAGALW